MADAVPAAVRAAQLAAAGLAPPPGAAYHGLSLVGEVDVDTVIADPDRWLCGSGYLKRHSACSYTHPAVDLVLALRGQLPEATSVHVRTGSLAAPLLGRDVPNRLAAMFSLPFAVATAWEHGEVTPAVMEPGTMAFARSRRRLDRVTVEVDATLDRWLPDRRVAEVRLGDGTTEVSLAAPNPVGDSDHFPLGHDDVRAKLASLVGAADADTLVAVMAGLAGRDDAVGHLAALP
jgi:2-methylcitrate dehydratase PrpD